MRETRSSKEARLAKRSLRKGAKKAEWRFRKNAKFYSKPPQKPKLSFWWEMREVRPHYNDALKEKYEHMRKDKPSLMFEVFRRDDINGCGLRVASKRGIPKGQFIGEYRGEWLESLPKESAQHEPLIKEIPNGDYLFTAYHPDNADQVLFTLDAEPKKGSNHTRYINHGCDPNCDIKIVEIEGTSNSAHPSDWHII
jgi:hypothetical protein